MFLTRMDTPGTTAPALSVTVPDTVAFVVCENRRVDPVPNTCSTRRKPKEAPAKIFRLDMSTSV
jgi:hypothetical protein